MEDKEKIDVKSLPAVILISILLFTGLIALYSVVEAAVILKLWSWFIVTGFGLPPITWQTALGLSLLLGFITHQTQPVVSNKRFFSNIILRSILIFLVGFIVHLMK